MPVNATYLRIASASAVLSIGMAAIAANRQTPSIPSTAAKPGSIQQTMDLLVDPFSRCTIGIDWHIANSNGDTS
jgi:hypothetical protein